MPFNNAGNRQAPALTLRRSSQRGGGAAQPSPRACDQAYAEGIGGEIVKLYRISETASKTDERKTFRALLNDARESSESLEGVLFYKVDRAARNLFDYVELERLEAEHGLRVVYVAQPTENTPAGRMQRRILANMASFYTEQQSVDVREGMERRVKEGLFVGHAPYGYRNVRRSGRSLVELHDEQAANVRRIFNLYAYDGHTIDSRREGLRKAEIHYTAAQPVFSRAKVHQILRDRCYIGEVQYRGAWYPGTHPAIVERSVRERVQALLGSMVYRAHELAYGGNLVKCGHCGRAVTGEQITKRSQSASIRIRSKRASITSSARNRVFELHARRRNPNADNKKAV